MTIQESSVVEVEELVTILVQVTVPPVGVVKSAGTALLEEEVSSRTSK